MDCVKCKAILPEGALYCPLCGKKQGPQERKHRKRANGSGTVYKMPGNRAKPWAAKRNNIFLGSFKTYAAAQKALERSTDADIGDKYNLTFSQVYELWKPVHARTVTASQMGCYKSAYKHCTALYGQKFRSLRKSDFEAVIMQMEAAGKSKSSCDKALQLFGQLSAWAMDESIINQNHAKNVRTAAQQKGTRKPFSDDQIETIKKSEHIAAPIARILISTGARPGELFSVPLENCRDDYFIGGSKTEAGKDRIIAVSPIGLDDYHNLLAAAREAGGQRLIDGYKGNRNAVNFQKRDFKAFMAELGCPDMTPYTCRHTFSTLAVRSGVSPQALRRMMGHADIKTADKYYTHLDAGDILGEIEKINTSSAVVSKLSALSDGSSALAAEKLEG